MTRHRPLYVAVVRPGERELYQTLKSYLEARGVAEVVWDRRIGERRRTAGRQAERTAAGERRARERRDARPRDRDEVLGFFLTRRADAGRMASDR